MENNPYMAAGKLLAALYDSMAAAQKIMRFYSESKSSDIVCPVCGFYCLGNGGIGCIDKPGMNKQG